MRPEDLIASSAASAVISDPRLEDNPIVACNDAFLALTGYAREEIIGHNCRFMVGPDTEPLLTEVLREGIRNQTPTMVEILNYKKDGTPFRNAVMVAPIFGENGSVRYFLGSQVEIVKDQPLALDQRRGHAHRRVADLTPRQREILIEMSKGKLNKQIAYDLGLTERTVKMHRAAMFRALEVKTSADAIRVAVEGGF
jgi:PAS domain S-box-containing protein